MLDGGRVTIHRATNNMTAGVGGISVQYRTLVCRTKGMRAATATSYAPPFCKTKSEDEFTARLDGL